MSLGKTTNQFDPLGLDLQQFKVLRNSHHVQYSQTKGTNQRADGASVCVRGRVHASCICPLPEARCM